MHDFFIRLVATLTQSSRYKIDFIPTNSIVCNAFRLWEFLAGRRVGIRCEQIVIEETVYSYSLENLLVTYEGLFLAFLKGLKPSFRIVRVPQLQLAGMAQGGISPYSFAIAFDAVGFATNGGASPKTWTHVVTGSNPNLVLCFTQTSGTDNTTSVTYNSSAMTKKVFGQSGGAQTIGMVVYYHGTPSTGSNTVSVTFSTGTNNRSGSASYSGCASSVDNSGTNGNSAGTSPFPLTITSVANNCWLTGMAVAGDATLAAGANTTQRGTVGDNFGIWFDGNAPITPAGSSTINATFTGNNNIIFGGVTIAPSTAIAKVYSPLITLLGVGI